MFVTIETNARGGVLDAVRFEAKEEALDHMRMSLAYAAEDTKVKTHEVYLPEQGLAVLYGMNGRPLRIWTLKEV